MSTMKITKQGRDIIANTLASGQTTGAKYWIGYYGLAYVDRDSEPLENVESKLTVSGDYIYNIWQGDLTGMGFADDDTSGAKSLFGLTMYARNICTNYRYVMSEDGRNNLVAWTSSGNNGSEDVGHREAYHVYKGLDADSGENSKIPLPAPLFYYNDPLGSSDTLAQPGGITESEFATGLVDYPHDGTLPRVSDDARYYTGETYTGQMNTFDTAIPGVNAGAWLSSTSTRRETTDRVCSKYAQFRSISNYNLQHGHVSSEGYNLSSVSACHNMSKATRLFPISNYTVLVDGQGANGNPETEISGTSASSIKFSISLSPATRDRTYLDVVDNDPGTITAPIYDGTTTVFQTKLNQFKFNRIGIYAVQMDVKRFGALSESDTCSADHVQFEIINDAEPILFAVADVSETIVSDSGNGAGKVELEFILSMDNGSSDSALIKDTGIFYNLYENSAITWYQNQLLASAGLSEAITGLGIDVANLKRQYGKGGTSTSASTTSSTVVSDSSGVDMSQYAKVNHTHSFTKNIVDGSTNTGSLRGVNTVADGYTADGVTYNLGTYAVALGYDTEAAGAYSIVHGISNSGSGKGTFIIGTEGSVVGGESNAVIGAESPVTVTGNGTSYNMVTAIVDLPLTINAGAKGNLVYGMTNDGSDPDQDDLKYTIGSSLSSMFYGTVRKYTGSATVGDIAASNVRRSIVGLNGSPTNCAGKISDVVDSVLIGSSGVVSNVSNSLMVAGCRAYGNNDGNLIVGGSYSHSVEYAEHHPGITDTTKYTVEHDVIGTTDTSAYGTSLNGSTQYNAWVGSGHQYGVVTSSIVVGHDDKIGIWHQSDYGAGSEHTRRSKSTSNIVVGDNNSVGTSTVGTLLVGDNNVITSHSHSIVVGDSNNYKSTTWAEYDTVDAMVAALGTVSKANGFVAIVYASATTSVKLADDSTARTLKPGTNALLKSQNGWTVFNKSQTWKDGPSDWGADDGFTRCVLAAGAPNDVKYSLMLGRNLFWGTGTDKSLIIGDSNDTRFIEMHNTFLLGDGFKFSPSENPAYCGSNVGKRFTNVDIFGITSSLNDAINGFSDASEKDYKDAMLFLGSLTAGRNARNLSQFLGTTSGAHSGTSKTYRPLLEWDSRLKYAGTYKWTSNGADITSIVSGSTSLVYEQLKPSASIIYTCGIALAGAEVGSTYGIVKLGSAFADYLTIVKSANDVISKTSDWTTDGWDSSKFFGARRGDVFDVKLVTGTKQCPYAGRTLVVDNTQEVDGSLHIKLGNYAAEPSLVTKIANNQVATLSTVIAATMKTNVYDHGVYTCTTSNQYIGYPPCDGLTFRMYISSAINIKDPLGEISGASLKMRSGESFAVGWYRLTSVDKTKVSNWSSVAAAGDVDYLWIVEKI